MAKAKKPCEFCGEEWFQNIELPNARCYLEVYPDNIHIAVIVQSDSDDHEMNGEESIDIPLNYCPNCGRKLGW